MEPYLPSVRQFSCWNRVVNVWEVCWGGVGMEERSQSLFLHGKQGGLWSGLSVSIHPFVICFLTFVREVGRCKMVRCKFHGVQ